MQNGSALNLEIVQRILATHRQHKGLRTLLQADETGLPQGRQVDDIIAPLHMAVTVILEAIQNSLEMCPLLLPLIKKS